MKTKHTNSEQELRKKLIEIIHKEHEECPGFKSVDDIMLLIQSEREKVLERVDKEVIGKKESILKCEPEENKIFWRGYNKAIKEVHKELEKYGWNKGYDAEVFAANFSAIITKKLAQKEKST